MGKEEVLLGLYASAAHNEQMEVWQEDLKAFEELKEDQDGELRRVRGEAYQVTTLYAMFQSVILTAVSQSNLLTCSLSWCPASLSIVASAAAFLAMADKLKSIGEVQEDIRETSLNISAVYHCLQEVNQEGSDFDLESRYPQVNYHRCKHAGLRYVLSRNGVSTLLFVAVFAIILTCFYIETLCRHCSQCTSR